MIILASSSARRRQLLGEWGIKFRICSPKVAEHSRYKRPHLVVQDISRKKVLAVAERYPKKIILGADTVVVRSARNGPRIIGKPENIGQAKKFLQLLSGTVHRVYTGVAVWSPSGKVYTDYALSRVKIKKIPREMLDSLAAKHLDKAGAYAVQEKNDLLVEKVWGDYYNVVGLPGQLTRKLLKKVQRLSSVK